MYTTEEIKNKIDYIIGCNTEITKDTHDQLCNEIYKLIADILSKNNK
jgi:hypothetical protein